MIEIRFHGRGGQGAVIGARILAAAVFSEGKYVQAFPAFGVERRGAPVTAFVRIDEKIIRLRHQIYHPDHLIVLDSTLMNSVSILEGFKPGGVILINTRHEPAFFRQNPIFDKNHIAAVDANAIAVKHSVGSQTSPIVNTAILGAFCKITQMCSLDSIRSAILKGVPLNAKSNADAASDAYEKVKNNAQT